MPDYDPKSIPVLDDIIEDEAGDADNIHEKIIISDEISNDDNTLDLFNHAPGNIEGDIEIEYSEPEIGAIDKFIEDDVSVNIEATGDFREEESREENHNEVPDAGETGSESFNEPDHESGHEPDLEPQVFESALIDYTYQNQTENSLELQAESGTTSEEINTDNAHALEEQSQNPSNINESAIIAEPAIALDVDAIINDVVSQVMPELEQQLRTRLKQALQESLPQEVIEETAPE